MEKSIIIANWKMNPQNLTEAKNLFNSVKRGAGRLKNIDLIVCPPFVYLSVLGDFISKKISGGIILGSQDCFWEQGSAFTGEVSPLMLRNLGCKYVILGHSERRKYLNETDETINKKIRAALVAKLQPIFCIGETQAEREKGETPNKLKIQIEQGLNGISQKEIKNLIIAYEPVWAIGTGRPCDIDTALSTRLIIRKIIAQIFSRSLSESIKILYGGSVNPENAAGYVKEAGLQGLVGGGASVDAKECIKIIKEISES